MTQASVRRFIFALVSTVLAGCGTTPLPEGTPPPIRYTYALSVEVTPEDTRKEVEARYGGDALIWYPNAGFAVLGVENSLTPPSVGAQNVEARKESNLDVFSIPSVSAQGRSSWAGGRSSWAGGWDAWAGGTDEAVSTTLEENLAAWRQVELAEAQALAPRLGAGVKVAVIDSGVDVTHPALQGKLAPEEEWRDYVDGDKLPLDERDPRGENAGHGHGTGVAGIILQVAPEATILPLRVLGPDGSGDLTNVAMAIDWAAEQGADIINLSLGSDGDTPSLAVSKVLAYARQQHGVLFVASSGNTGDERITFPASLARSSEHDSLVSVGSVDNRNVRSSFSTYGPNISLYAPGEKVHTLMPDQGVTHATGTSFAAPIVAGTLALALGNLDEGEDDAAAQVQALLSFANYEVDSRDDTRTGVLDAGRFLDTPEAVPGEVTLEGGAVPENRGAGAVVGRFSASDGTALRYSLVAGEADNASFTLVGDELRTAERFDFEAKRSYDVLIEASIPDGGSTQKRFVISVQDLDDEDPTVSFNHPGALTEGKPVTLTGSAADNVGLSKLELYENDLLLGEATLAPSGSGSDWRYLYTPRSAGTFTLKSVAHDAAGNTQAKTLRVTVAQVERWPVQFGSDTTEDDAESITVDAAGNLYIAGKTGGDLAGTSSGNRDAFVMKLNRRGERVWADQFGSGGDDEAEGIAADAAGNLYVVGYTHGSLEGSNAGNTDPFIAKYRRNGEQAWRRQFGTAGHEEAEAVAVDAAGDVYITGHTTNGSANFDREVFITKYDSSGVQQWFKQFGSAANEEGNAIAVDAAGNVYVAGYTGGDLVSLGSNIGGFDIFIARYDSDGNQAWLEQFGSEVDEEGKGIVVDAAGDVYVTGYTRGSLAYENAGNSDMVVAKYDSGGNQAWLEQFGSAADDGASAAAIDAQGHIIVTGYTYGDAAGTYAGSGDILTAAYDSAGKQVWAEQRGSAEYDEADAVAADTQGNIFITGYTKSALDGAPITGENIFVMKLRSSAASQ